MAISTVPRSHFNVSCGSREDSGECKSDSGTLGKGDVCEGHCSDAVCVCGLKLIVMVDVVAVLTVTDIQMVVMMTVLVGVMMTLVMAVIIEMNE